MLCRESLNIFDAGDQGGTYTGQPLAMSVGLAVLDAIEKDKVLDNCNAQRTFLIEQLQELSKTYAINNIRGKGLLLAFDLGSENAAEVTAACMEKGLLINAPKPYSIRLMPALIVSQAECQKMLDILTPHLKKRQDA